MAFSNTTNKGSDDSEKSFTLPDIFQELERQFQNRVMSAGGYSAQVETTGRIKDKKETALKHTRGNQLSNLKIRKYPETKKESVREYQSQQRELFLLQYSLDVKREEIQKLKQITEDEERKLAKAEKLLEEDSLLFEEFLKADDHKTMDAIEKAEKETQVKHHKIAEVKKLSTKIAAVQSEIAKYEDILKDYQKCEEFLLMLSPVEWQEKHRNRSLVSEPESSEVEEPLIYFKDPQELLNLMTDLEEQNLFLIQQIQETEETIKEFSQNAERIQSKMDSESKQSTEQIEVLQKAVQEETNLIEELELAISLISSGKVGTDDQVKGLEHLRKKVKEVYRCCVTKTDAELSTLQMLKAIEDKVIGLLESADKIQRDCIAKAERAVEKERRIRVRDEKKRLQLQQQEERRKKVLERSLAVTEKKVFKKLMPRSQSLARKLQTQQKVEATSEDGDELLDFLS